MNKLKVLLADDNKELITVLSEYISLQEDMEVVEVAGNGNEVLSVLRQRDIDILILDAVIHDLDGVSVLEELKENPTLYKRPRHIIMFTAFNQEKIMMRAAELGASYFIMKHILGGNMLFSKNPYYPMTITAQEDAVILEIARETLFDIFCENPVFLRGFLEIGRASGRERV